MKLFIAILVFSQLSFGNTRVTYTNSYSDQNISSTEMTLSIVAIIASGALLWGMLKNMGNQAQKHLKKKEELEKRIKELKNLQKNKEIRKNKKILKRI